MVFAAAASVANDVVGDVEAAAGDLTRGAVASEVVVVDLAGRLVA